MIRKLLLPVSLAALALGLAGCSPAASGASAPGGAGEPLPAGAVVIDVRTPEEYATGHLEGARLLDLTGGELEAAIPGLDPAADYYVYCRSGNRSGQAEQLMRAAGIDRVTNLGSVQEASESSGIGIVTE